MPKFRLKPKLGMLFIVAVVIPSVILSLMAIRAVSREEAYIEKRLEETLLAEIDHAVSLVNTELREIQGELVNTASIPEDGDYARSFLAWKEASSLVGIPYLLSPTHKILWPKFDQGLTNEELCFLGWARDFFHDRTSIPIPLNIALAYKDEIMKESPRPQLQEREESGQRDTDKTGSYSYKDQYRAQQALSRFRQDEPVRREVYEQAEKKGQRLLSRIVEIPAKGFTKQKESQGQKSMFVLEPLRFSQIIAEAESGIIPNLIEERLRLIFWKKDKAGRIVGCVISQEGLIERILGVLPDIYSPVRILTILDERARPLIAPLGDPGRNWRRPFVAREISEILPHWEMVAYLTDPNVASSKAHMAALIMWMLVIILIISITTGGVLILKSLYSEMALAKQKTTFVANVSHELKTPLTSIRLFTEMLKERCQPDEAKRKKYLDIMLSETERLTRLINNVLDFSRMEQGKRDYNMRELDLISLCKNIFEGQRVRLEHNGFEVSFRADTECLIVQADEEAIKQVALNLLANAEKYSDKRREISIELVQSQNSALINIKDRGIGIPSREAENIFKEFYRVDDTLTSRVRGSGLGLTIAQRIIQDHHGEILYLPREGGGSIFQIRLPLKGERP
ncbi:TPA: hypothetical protein DCX15_02125 [bacterium]|nr:hypothetical protein [bacterium]